MSQESKIEWTDATWNPVRGCTKISPGCAHCYAETLAERFRGVKGHPYEQGFDLRLVPEKLMEPLKWKKPRRVFVNSMSDLFHDGVPDEYIDKVFAVMALCPQHTFQVLTKRAERMMDYCSQVHRISQVVANGYLPLNLPSPPFPGREWYLPLANVLLGVSVEDQKRADERIPLLLQTPAAVRFLSCEPLLGPLKINPLFIRPIEGTSQHGQRFIDWVIVGGESGSGARPFVMDWGISIIKQCRAAGVAVFMKQVGSNPCIREGVSARGITTSVWGPISNPKGGDPAEWPEDLRVREFPNVHANI
jgi:protein gp37